MKNSFKAGLIITLSAIAVLLGFNTYKKYFLISVSEKYSVICSVKKGRSAEVKSQDEINRNGCTNIEYIDWIKQFVATQKLKYILLNPETLKISTFNSKEEANSFAFELKQYFPYILTGCYVSE